jgi:hypothetical protein
VHRDERHQIRPNPQLLGTPLLCNDRRSASQDLTDQICTVVQVRVRVTTLSTNTIKLARTTTPGYTVMGEWCRSRLERDYILGVTLFRLGHAMPYMIPYYQSGLLVTFRCTDCDWTYTIHNPCSAPVPHDEEEKAKEQYVAHRCSEC